MDVLLAAMFAHVIDSSVAEMIYRWFEEQPMLSSDASSGPTWTNLSFTEAG